jgi:hypothetical protein
MSPSTSPPVLFRSAVSNTDSRVWLLTVGLFLLLLAVLVPVPAKALICGFIGTALLIIYGIAALSQEIFELDKVRAKYRQTQSVLGISGGEWQALPAIRGVIVKYFSQYEAPSRRRMATNARPVEYYIVLLSVENRPTGIIVHKFPARQLAAAQSLAARLAAYL